MYVKAGARRGHIFCSLFASRFVNKRTEHFKQIFVHGYRQAGLNVGEYGEHGGSRNGIGINVGRSRPLLLFFPAFFIFPFRSLSVLMFSVVTRARTRRMSLLDTDSRPGTPQLDTASDRGEF